VNSDDVSGWP